MKKNQNKNKRKNNRKRNKKRNRNDCIVFINESLFIHTLFILMCHQKMVKI